MLERIGPLRENLPPAPGQQKADSPRKGEKGDFLETLKGFMSEVNQLQKEAGESINRLAAGDVSNVHDVMIAVEKASVSFELMMEIRNKIIEAYHEVMRMQM